MRIEVEVTVRGLGTTFDDVIRVIVDECLKRGASVGLKNDHPGWGEPSDDLSGYHVAVNAVHVPWPG